MKIISKINGNFEFYTKKFILILVFYGLYVIGFFSYRKFNFDANVHFFYFLVFFL